MFSQRNCRFKRVLWCFSTFRQKKMNRKLIVPGRMQGNAGAKENKKKG
jgi:hypothetical protein